MNEAGPTLLPLCLRQQDGRDYVLEISKNKGILVFAEKIPFQEEKYMPASGPLAIPAKDKKRGMNGKPD